MFLTLHRGFCKFTEDFVVYTGFSIRLGICSPEGIYKLQRNLHSTREFLPYTENLYFYR
jgi:hypothetical protein